MSLFDWLAGLFGGKPAETAEAVADRIERCADRFAHTGDDAAAADARTAANAARMASTVEAARQIEAEFLRSHGLRPDGRPIKPALGRGPDGTDYVRYGTGLRAGGSRAWRYNNPGYVRCTSRSASYGALSCDGEYAIFPNYSTGVYALRQSLRDEYPNHTVRDALRQHLPPEAGADPERLCDEAGLDPSAKVEEVTDADCGAIGSALEQKSGWEEGQHFDRGAEDAPGWVDTAWGPTAGEDAGDVGAGGDFGPPDSDSPSDDS